MLIEKSVLEQIIPKPRRINFRPMRLVKQLRKNFPLSLKYRLPADTKKKAKVKTLFLFFFWDVKNSK